MQVAKDKVVLFHYTLTDAAGTRIDSSREAEPLAILHGHGSLSKAHGRTFLCGKTLSGASTTHPQQPPSGNESPFPFALHNQGAIQCFQ